MPGGLPVLTYHSLDSSGSVLSTDPSWFAETLAALAEAGFRSVDLHEWIALGRPEVDRGFALAFDDGLRSIAQAAPLLERHGFTATAFLVTGRMGTDNAWPGQPTGLPRFPLLSWSDLPALASSGFRFAAHSRTHARLDRLDTRSLERELQGSCEDLADRVGRSSPLLAYPYGVASARVRAAAARHFDAAFGTRLDEANGRQAPYRISRVDAFYLRSPQALERLATGRLRPYLRVRRALREMRGMARSLVPGKARSPMGRTRP
jgi:peptidoglycan/xylan/chitin deacetylase (PgdA/CDA1 family)